MLKRLLVLFLLLAVPVQAEIGGATNITVPASSVTVTLTATAKSLLLIMESASSADAVYFRVFYCGETPAPASNSSPIRLDKGEFIQFTHESFEPGAGYCAFSASASGGSSPPTAKIRYIVK